VLRRMLEAASFSDDAAIDILDVGAGYGVVTEEALRIFPKARVVLQDHSRPMLERAQAPRRGTGPALCPVRPLEPSWTKAVGGPFDLAISGIALHNLSERKIIFGVYRAIEGLLKPGVYFLNYDRFHGIGVKPHLEALREAGFAAVEVPWQEPPVAIVIAGPRP